ncbi:hypothetical protein BDZ91DRAFT_718864 [Kalaharituber pfeilii]|nr:hypothetical protein BDZ91DRAFT_718864 [Kalaharituber pfeilii]
MLLILMGCWWSISTGLYRPQPRLPGTHLENRGTARATPCFMQYLRLASAAAENVLSIRRYKNFEIHQSKSFTGDYSLNLFHSIVPIAKHSVDSMII